MLTITIVAACLIALATAIAFRQASAVRVRTADERGITLQTLIVTAVLVLMAVAAGVVIVAITNSASDDLEDQTTSIDANCEGDEIYDPVAAANGVTPIRAGHNGSAIGCIPVCYWTEADGEKADDVATSTIGTDEIDFFRDQPDPVESSGTVVSTTNGGDNRDRFLFTDTKSVSKDNAAFESPIDQVRVNPNQRTCNAYNSRGDIV